jgi:hypothetical protein
MWCLQFKMPATSGFRQLCPANIEAERGQYENPRTPIAKIVRT